MLELIMILADKSFEIFFLVSRHTPSSMFRSLLIIKLEVLASFSVASCLLALVTIFSTFAIRPEPFSIEEEKMLKQYYD